MPVDFELAEAGYKCETKNIDKNQVYQLDLWYSNDYDLYRVYYAWVKNYARKMKSGRYTKKLAVKGIALNYVPRIITHFKKNNNRESYRHFSNMGGAVNKCTKLKLGLEIVNEIESAIKDSGIEYWIKHAGR